MAISAQLKEQQLELARLAAALGRQPLEADPVARLLLAADEEDIAEFAADPEIKMKKPLQKAFLKEFKKLKAD